MIKKNKVMKVGALVRRKWASFDRILFHFMQRWVLAIISQDLSGFLFCASTAGWSVRALSVFSSARGGCRACGASCWMWSCDPSCWVQGGAAEDSASTWLENDTPMLGSWWADRGLSSLSTPSLKAQCYLPSFWVFLFKPQSRPGLVTNGMRFHC